VSDQASRDTGQQALAEACRAFTALRMVVPVDEEAVPRYLLQRMYALMLDVQCSVEVLLSTYVAAQEVVARRRGVVGRRELSALEFFQEFKPQEQFITAFKSVFFFVRAYQDAVAGVFFVLLHGAQGGVIKSMSDALKPGKPIGKLLDEKLPGYRNWFEQWREDRGKIKNGADFELRYDADDNLTLSFLYAQEKGTKVDADTIGLSNIVEGLEMSTRLAATAFSMVPGGLYRIVWPPPEETL
jgi:hypothetical protein